MLIKNNLKYIYKKYTRVNLTIFTLLIIPICFSISDLQFVQAFNINPLPTTCPILDVDSNGKLEAFVDGVLLTRIINAKLSNADIATSTKDFVSNNKSAYDVDGDGTVNSNIDGVLITRYLLGIEAPKIFEGIQSFPDTVKQDKTIQNLNTICGKLPATVTPFVTSTSTVIVDVISASASTGITTVDIASTSTDTEGDAPDTSETDTVCIDLTVDMKFKSRDQNSNGGVSDLQNFLSTYGYYTPEPSGYFGKSTVSAVKSFQSANGLIASGVVGAYTRAKIKSISCSDSPVNAVDDGIDKTRTQIQIIKSSPRASVRIVDQAVSAAPVASPVQVIKTLPVKLPSTLFSTESLVLTSDNMTLKIRALASSDDSYVVTIYYKNSNRTCMLSSGFTPTVKQVYTIDRTIYSICKNGNTVDDFSTIDYIVVERK
jgi:peptidoglycan hydrolase-like protein with peptidoglycan-binding domain